MNELVTLWRTEATTLERNGYGEAARVLERCATDVESYQPTETVVPLAAATRHCQYTYQHLWRLVRDGRLTNYGTPKRIRVRLSELPRKAGLR